MKLRLRVQCFEVLAVLVEHAGEVVTRESLRSRLWPQDVFVDFDNSLNTAIARLREALHDSTQHPRFIETLPKRGYRFIGHVLIPPVPRARLMVLPFANLSGDSAQEYFSDSITEDIIAELARLAPDRLAVIARTTAMVYKDSKKDIARIGRELALQYVLEGSVWRAGDRFSVTVQLIQVAGQVHLLAQRYDGEIGDIFRIRKAVGQAIADHFGIVPPPSARQPCK